MRTKLYVLSAVIIAALGLSLFLSPPAHAAPICGDTDYAAGGSCPTFGEACDDKGQMGPPCVPIDYSKVANCDANPYANSYESPSRCRAIKKCIADRKITSAACLQEWVKCRDPLMNADGKMRSGDREGCMNAIATGTPYVAPVTTPPDVTAPPADATGNKTSCNVDGIGWIICPVMRFMSQIVDGAYSMVSRFLSVPSVDTSTDSPMYKAWSVMRNFANVAFVMSFLVIIYSQITGAGVSNYGIKKMLPRLIIAAVLVNVSYWVCAIAVDLSNILGVSFKGLLEGTANQLYTPGDSTASTGAGGDWDGLTVILLGTAAVGAALYVGLSAFLPILIAAAFAIVSVVIVLTLRQALIIILIVVSPLAFVAYLLPNTEGLFNKWRGTFQALLIMYPILAVVFGGSALASTIITNSAKGDFTLQVVGAGVSIVPLFLAPLLIKAGNAALNRVGISLNDPTKGPVDRLKRGAEGFRKNRQQLRDARALNGGSRIGGSIVRRRARRQAVLSQRERNYNNAKSGYIADASLSTNVSAAQRALNVASGGRLGGKTAGDQLLNQMANGGGPGAKSAALAQALTVQANLEAEEVKAATATIKALNLSQDERRTIARGGEVIKDGRRLNASEDSALQRAGMQSVVESNDIKGINDLVNDSTSWSGGEEDTKLRQSLADSLASSGSRPGYLGQGVLDTIRQGTNTKSANALIEQAVRDDVYSAEKIATTDKDELNVVAGVSSTSALLSLADKQKLVNNADKALTDPILSLKIGKNLGNVTHLKNHTAPPPLT